MSTNLPSSSSTVTFTSINGLEIQVDANVYNQIFTFCAARTSSQSAAGQLTQSVLVLTYGNSLDPLTIINEFNKAANESELKTLLIALFNSLRPATSKVGFSYNIVPNQWIIRNIIS